MRQPATQLSSAPAGGTDLAAVRSGASVWLLAALLGLVTVIVYWPATGHGFVNYDDPLYLTDNPHVQAGLTWDGIAWAFGRIHGEGTYWHPLTWVSHMIDCQLYGLKPWGHHLTNVLLHALNAVLVFLVFRRMTGAFWRCAMLAALFALHPLQVDTVAWVAERKNLLAIFFWLLTTWAYVRYAQVQSPTSTVQSQEPRGTVSRITHHASRIPVPPSRFYLSSLALFALGLMCKPVLVTLPFVLLLLDYWPLRRVKFLTRNVQPLAAGPVLWEKIPFLLLAMTSSVITLTAHQGLGALEPFARYPWDLRVSNALVSYVRYLGKILWPSRLAIFYPYPDAWPACEVVACALVLLVVSVLSVKLGRSRPWLFVGWLWFLAVLVPFIGLVQAGEQAISDRFMYAPAMGVMLAVVWGLHELGKRGRWRRLALAEAALLVILLCVALTRQQLGYWKDGETLFRHALEVTGKNWLAQNNLGYALDRKGQLDEAIRHLREAVRLKPDYARAHYNLASALAKTGQTDEAIRHYQESLRLKPNNPDAHNNLGNALAEKGQFDEAIGHLDEALRLRPNDAGTHNNLAIALCRKGRVEEAIRQFQAALRLRPDYADARNNLEAVLAARAASSRPPAGSP